MKADIVLFTSPTCPHCHHARAALISLNREDVEFLEISTGTKEGAEIASQQEIMSVPTIFVHGPEVEETIAFRGMPTMNKLNEAIDSCLGINR